MRRRVAPLVCLLALSLWPVGGPQAGAEEQLDKRAIQDLASRWFAARPPTRFERWDPEVRRSLLAEARALGEIPEGSLEAVRDLLWKAVKKYAPRPREAIDTPYGEATWIQGGRGGRKAGLMLGLHGGGEGAGSASEAAGKWVLPRTLAMYPQGIR
ncbi:MAG: hypothetical protein ACYTG6_03735, partial [Planctomycetota bacterium]